MANWLPILLPGMLVLLSIFKLGSKYLLPAKEVNFYHCLHLDKYPKNENHFLSEHTKSSICAAMWNNFQPEAF